MTEIAHNRPCAVCGGRTEIISIERRVNTVVKHIRCRGDCPDIGGHVVMDLKGNVRRATGPVIKGKSDLLVASALDQDQRAGRAD